MEADERPMKLRKLDHDKDDVHQVPTTQSSSSVADTFVTSEPSHNSKADERTANVADRLSDHNEDNKDGVGSGAAQNGQSSTDSTQHHGEEVGEPAKPMSKSQIKKQRKREEWEAARGDRKLKRKERLQAKKARKKAAREEEELRIEQAKKSAVERGEDPDSVVANLKAQASAQQKQKSGRPILLPVTIIIDCGFDDLMMEKERISLGSQITRSYSDNYRAPFQAHLVISSWGGLLKERFDTVLSKHYLNWKNVVFEDGDFVEAVKNAAAFMRGPNGGKLAGYFEKAKTSNVAAEKAEASHNAVSEDTTACADDDTRTDTKQPAVTEQSVENGDGTSGESGASTESTAQTGFSATTHSSGPAANHLPQGEVVYLTSDSPHTLSELSPYSTYIVGGLVDKNRHKGICYKIARERGIKTAKLPIGEFLEMQSRKVLATNHVVEIMVRWLECGDWGEAFMKVIPKRKGGKLRAESEQQSDEEEDGHDGDDGADKGHDEIRKVPQHAQTDTV
ncbi:tRNA (guanine(9)-N1)-methyltransferase [Exophiala spinifera]|uniref:tRNA (guanine(9)-N1)-methyltransferase n=1 Tax=Exophiala spinifera TaxID=91928 RepID=A0A0D2B8S5_9EURO|nr:tRNA (guanine(9)-N1)-methyltransferase [Exophiala spinifera]KIW15050.1 tRNA (guanine(9)-N1)-methyltransferase [Exophiala spinifera]